MVVGNHPTERIQKEQGNPGSRPLPPFCFNGKLPFGWWWTPTQIMVKLGSSNGEDSTKMGGSKHFQGVGIPWIDLIPSSLQCKGHWSYLWQVLVVSIHVVLVQDFWIINSMISHSFRTPLQFSEFYCDCVAPNPRGPPQRNNSAPAAVAKVHIVWEVANH